MKKVNLKLILKAFYNYIVFFVLIGFSITCCMMLFMSVMGESLDIEFTAENINLAAKLTFLNVVILSLAYHIIDVIRRKITVERPVKKIAEGAERIIEGDFSVRIDKIYSIGDNSFNTIIESFNKMAEELSGIETLRKDFIANVSHELKTPLAVIQSYSTMLQRENLSKEEREEYSKIIAHSSKKLADLITNILKLNKLENQQIFPEKKVYNLSEQLCECLLDFENVWEKKNLDLKVSIQEDIYVESDRELLSLVWNNLFSNAIKFTDSNGSVSVSLTGEGGYACVTVSDTGCGISREVGAHIFEKFYQGDTSHSGEGNGLGLALVKRVVDITESEIGVTSELGKGSKFTVKLKKVNRENAQKNIV